MGVKLTKIDELDIYRSKINQIGKLQVERLMVPWYLSDRIYHWLGNGKQEQKLTDQAHEFTGNVIATKRKAFLANQHTSQNTDDDETEFDAEKKRLAMLDTLLMAESQNSIDGAGIQEEVDTFVFEGFDTTMVNKPDI